MQIRLHCIHLTTVTNIYSLFELLLKRNWCSEKKKKLWFNRTDRISSCFRIYLFSKSYFCYKIIYLISGNYQEPIHPVPIPVHVEEYCQTKGSYCLCHYCKCEKGTINCKNPGYGKIFINSWRIWYWCT